MFVWLILSCFSYTVASDCYHPGVPEYANLVIRDNIATYGCQNGYHLLRPANRICDRTNRTWSGSTAVCGLDLSAGRPTFSTSIEGRNFSAFATDIYPTDRSVQNDQSCFISAAELHPILIVDMLRPGSVDYFAVRKLGYSSNMTEESKEIVEIFVANSTTGMEDSNLCAKFQVIEPEDNILLSGPCRYPIRGRYVIIRGYRNDLSASVKLGLCSVKVFSRQGVSSSQCPSATHIFLEGSCYSVESDKADWSESEQNCNTLGGHLVTIESWSVQQFFYWELRRLRNLTLLTGGEVKRPQLHWIGAHLDNRTLFNATESPNSQELLNSTSKNDCVAIKTSDNNEPILMRINCDIKAHSLCEYKIRYCRAPAIPENIRSYSPIQDVYRVGQTVTFLCEEQTVLVGSADRFCLSDGKWSGTAAICRSNKSPIPTQTSKPTLICSKPQSIEFGFYTVMETDVANFVEYKCDSGYSLQGNSYSICVYPGFWNGSAPNCVKNDDTSIVTHFSGTFAALPTSKSVANLTWSNIWSPKVMPTATPYELSLEPHTIRPISAVPIRCEYPPQIANGAYLYDSDDNAIGTFLIYTCQPGYTLIGDRVIQCIQNGNWSNIPPTCQNLTALEESENITITVENTTKDRPLLIHSINNVQQTAKLPNSLTSTLPTGQQNLNNFQDPTETPKTSSSDPASTISAGTNLNFTATTTPNTTKTISNLTEVVNSTLLSTTVTSDGSKLLTTSKNHSDYNCPRLEVVHGEAIYLTDDTVVGSKVFLRCEPNFSLRNLVGPAVFECLTEGIWNGSVEPVCIESKQADSGSLTHNVLVDTSGVNLSNIQNGPKENQFNWALVVTCIVAVVIFIIICVLAVVGIVYRHRRHKRKSPAVIIHSDIQSGGDLESRRTSNVGDMSGTYMASTVDSSKDRPAQVYAIYDSSLSRTAQVVKLPEETLSTEPIETPIRSIDRQSIRVSNNDSDTPDFYGYPMELVTKPITRVLLVQNRLAPESLYILPFDRHMSNDDANAKQQQSGVEKTSEGVYMTAANVPKRQNQPEIPPLPPRVTVRQQTGSQQQFVPLAVDVDTGSQTSLPSRNSDVNSRLKEIGVVKPVRNHHYKELPPSRSESILVSDHIMPSTSTAEIATVANVQKISPIPQRRQIHVRDLQEEIVNSPLFQKLRRKYGDAQNNPVVDTEAPTVRISQKTRIPLPPPPLPPMRIQPDRQNSSPPLKEAIRSIPVVKNNLKLADEKIYQNPGYSPTQYKNLSTPKSESPDVHNFGRKSLRVSDDSQLQHIRPTDIRDLVYLPRIRGSPDRSLRSQQRNKSIDQLIDRPESPEFAYATGHSEYPFGQYRHNDVEDDQISLNGVENSEENSEESLTEDEFRIQRQGYVNGPSRISPTQVATHSPLYKPANQLRRVAIDDHLNVRDNGYNNSSFVSESDGSENESPLVYTNNLRRHSLNEHHSRKAKSAAVGGSYRVRRHQDINDPIAIYDGPKKSLKSRHHRQIDDQSRLELTTETRPYGNETVDHSAHSNQSEFNSRLISGRGDILDLDPLADYNDQWQQGRFKPKSNGFDDQYRPDGQIWDSKPLRSRSKRVQFKDEVDQFEPPKSKKSGRKKLNK